MTLTLPTPDAGDTARQRFALELLLQQPVPPPHRGLANFVAGGFAFVSSREENDDMPLCL